MASSAPASGPSLPPSTTRPSTRSRATSPAQAISISLSPPPVAGAAVGSSSRYTAASPFTASPVGAAARPAREPKDAGTGCAARTRSTGTRCGAGCTASASTGTSLKRFIPAEYLLTAGCPTDLPAGRPPASTHTGPAAGTAAVLSRPRQQGPAWAMRGRKCHRLRANAYAELCRGIFRKRNIRLAPGNEDKPGISTEAQGPVD